jgi:fatty-acyl-CoA synthase
MSTLVECLRERAAATPDAIAVYVQHAGREDLGITYQRLLAGARLYAALYQDREIGRQQVIVLILEHGEELLYAFWGAVLHGAIPSIMPFLTEKLSPEQYRNDLSALLKVTRAAAVVTYNQFEMEVRRGLGEGSGVQCIVAPSLPRKSWTPERFASATADADESEIALLQHSSGTTGLQKGVALSHRAILSQIESYGRVLALRPDDVIVSWLPLYHDMGLIAGFLLPISTGIPLVLSSPFDWVRAPWRLLGAVSQYKGTLSWLPNFALNFCAHKIRRRQLENVDLSSWRAVINCSEPVRIESHRSFFEAFKGSGLRWEALQTCYAMAENVFGVTQSVLGTGPVVQVLDRRALMERGVAEHPSSAASKIEVMSSGRALPNTQVQILGEDRSALDDGHAGEIAIRSDSMLTGYFNRPDADRRAFHDGWYLTGDIGFLIDGELYVVGRKKDLIIVGGKNVYPQDLEALSYEVPGVHAGRSVAFGIFSEANGTEEVFLIAEVDSEDAAEQQRTADLIRTHVTRNSAVALRNVRVVGPRWILKTSSGKTAREANKRKYMAEAGTSDA